LAETVEFISKLLMEVAPSKSELIFSTLPFK